MSGDRTSAGSAPRPFDLTAVEPATATAFAWRMAGGLHVTVVVKAAFVIVPEGPMAPAQPEDIVRADVHTGGSVARSVRLTPDLAPRMPRADVVLTGHACAPEGQTARWMPARLALFRDRALLDKTIYVYGDQAGEVPFDRIPLVYERAYGGLGFAENPLGTGTLELSSRPNLVHPDRADRVACFAPIARTWPARRRIGGAPEVRKVLDAPVPEIPEGFDWNYFQAAPPDQRVDHLTGDEWLVLEGMSPTFPRLRSRLPSARAVALVYGVPGVADGSSLDLTADTLRVDTDRMGCSLVWRGDFMVPNEEALAAIRIVAGVESEGLPIAWPVTGEAPATEITSEPTAPLDEVIELDSDALVPLSTVTLDAEPKPENSAPAVPFVAAPARSRAATVVLPAPSEHFGDTLAISPEMIASPRSLPFERPLVTTPPPWSMETTIERPVVIAPRPSAEVTLDVSSFARPEIVGPPTIEPVTQAAPHKPPAEITPEGIRLDNTTPLALGVIPWGLTPSRGCLAVIAKATCDLVPGDRATLRDKAEPLGGDVIADGGAHCLHPTDLAPFKVRADILAVGHAHAPGGSATAMDVTFRFGHEGNAFTRTIRVFGDRRWSSGAASAAIEGPELFGLVPLTYARAFGGRGYDQNPIGLGLVDPWRHARAKPLLPNLEDPDHLLRIPVQRVAPACFAPIPTAWRANEKTERRAPWPFFPEDLDWTRHQSAPRSQQLPDLQGDEPFALTGMHRAHATLEGSLPAVRPRAFASRADDRFEEIGLRLDTVVIDADAMKVTLVWRGVLTALDEARPEVNAVHLLTEDLASEGITLDAARARFVG